MNGVGLFIKKTVILLLPLLLLLGFFEFKLREIPNIFKAKRESFEKQLDSINVLVLGDSHPLTSVNPEFFSYKGYNLCHLSQSIFFDTELGLKYIDRIKNLKCIVLNISYFSLWHELCDGEQAWRDYYYSFFWDIKYPDLKWYDSKNYSLIMLYTPQEALGYAKHKFREKLPEKLNRYGWVKYDTIPDNKYINEKAGKERADFHTRLCQHNRYNEIYPKLEKFVSECKKRNLELVFISTPVMPAYYKNLDPQINARNLFAIQGLCNKYGYQYFDYTRDDRFSLREFVDNDHLNFLGSEKFSKILNEDIISKINSKGWESNTNRAELFPQLNGRL
jgi:hypothetical protein